MFRPTAAAVLLVLISAAPGRALDGNAFLDYCRPSASHGDRMFSYGFVLGAVHAHNMVTGIRSVRPLFCSPSNATAGQMRDIVCDYIQRNPQGRHQEAVLLTALALSEAFPCR